METNTILIIVNMLLTTIGPLVTSLSFLLKRMKSSQCCGSRVSFTSQNGKHKSNVV